jgi:hypothetical protein
VPYPEISEANNKQKGKKKKTICSVANMTDDDVVGNEEIHNPNYVYVNGPGGDGKDIANDCDPVCKISASELPECDGDFHRASDYSNSECHLGSSNCCDTDSECEWSSTNSYDTDSELEYSSTNSCDNDAEYELSSREDCDSDSDFEKNDADYLETPESDNDELLRSVPAFSTQNDLEQQKKVRRLQQQILRLKK